MGFISDFYHGNLSPHERVFLSGGTAEKAAAILSQNEEALENELSDEQKIKFLSYIETCAEVNAHAEEDAFISGFRLGVSFVLDSLLGSPKEFESIK